MERTDREPCPWRIVDDAGGAFLFGTIETNILFQLLLKLHRFSLQFYRFSWWYYLAHCRRCS